MRRRALPFPVLLATLAIGWSSAAAAHASDERHDPRVGSLHDFRGQTAPGSGPPAVVQAAPGADPLANGIAIGALIGAGTGLGLMAWAYEQCDGSCDAPEPAPMYLMAGGMGAAVGGVVGFILDKVRKNTSRRIAISGAAGLRRSQVRVTVGW